MDIKRLHLVLIILLSVLVYVNTLDNEFVWDDHTFIVEGTTTREVSNIPSFFYTRYESGYRPVKDIFYTLLYKVGGVNPFPYHIFAIIVHASASVLVYTIANRITSPRASLMSALLFATHPAHTESISFITVSLDEIGALFFLLSFYLYITRNPRWKSISFILAMLAFFTYEITLTLPLILILYDYTFNGTKKINIKGYIPYFFLSFLYLFIRFILLGVVAKEEYFVHRDIFYVMINLGKIFFKYVILLFIPANLTVYPDINPETSFLSPTILISWIVLIFILILLPLLNRFSKIAFFTISWFFITLLPVSNIIIPLQGFLQERYLYLPSVGFSILFGYIVNHLYNKYSGKKKWVPIILFSIIILVFSTITIERNSDWQNDLSLWSATVEASPTSDLAHYNLGKAYEDDGQYEAAILEYSKAIELNPYYKDAYNNLGIIYMRLGRYEDGITVLAFIVDEYPNSAVAHYNLGAALLQSGHLELAALEMNRSIALNPDFQNNVKNTYIQLARESLQNNSPETAALILEGALKIFPNDMELHEKAGDVYYFIGQYESAILHYQQALTLKPSDNLRRSLANAHNDLGARYAQQGMYDKAIDEFTEALKINPDLVVAKDNLERAQSFDRNQTP